MQGLISKWRQCWANKGLAVRFLVVYLTLSLVTVSLLTWRSGTQLSRALEEEYEHELETEAFIVAAALSSDVEDMLDGERKPIQVLSLMRRFATDTESRITFISSDTRVVFSTDPAIPPGEPQPFPEVMAALQRSEQHTIRTDPYTGDVRLFVAAPLIEEEHLIGVVRISVPWERVRVRIVGEWTRLILTGLLLIAANVLVSLWLAFSIVRPLRELTAAAQDIASGNLSRRIPVSSKDEVGQLAYAFNEMAERLQEMIEQQRLFIANASHELRSPLTSLKLRTEALVEDKNMTLERKERFIRELDREVDRLRRLAERLLDLTRLQVKPKPQHPTPVSITEVIQDVVETLKPRAERQGINLVVDMADKIPPVYGSREDLFEIVVNLLDNAIKYTPSGGTVRVEAHEENGQVVIRVSDTGEGIPKESLHHIFEPFYRVDKARSRRIGGSGLGLAIVKALTDTYHGTIDVQSSPGKGTTFTVKLPARSEI